MLYHSQTSLIPLSYSFNSVWHKGLYVMECCAHLLRPVYTGAICRDFSGDFCCDFVAISRRFQITRVNYWRFRGDSLHGRFEIAAKIASVNGPLDCAL